MRKVLDDTLSFARINVNGQDRQRQRLEMLRNGCFLVTAFVFTLRPVELFFTVLVQHLREPLTSEVHLERARNARRPLSSICLVGGGVGLRRFSLKTLGSSDASPAPTMIEREVPQCDLQKDLNELLTAYATSKAEYMRAYPT